jgi:hypothetical protein
LKYALEFLEANDDGEEDIVSRIATVRASIAEAEAGGVSTAAPETDPRALLAKCGQIAAIWSTEDVRSIRPDLTEEQTWQVLLDVEHWHDASIGINWLTLEGIARELFGDGPKTGEPE